MTMTFDAHLQDGGLFAGRADPAELVGRLPAGPAAARPVPAAARSAAAARQAPPPSAGAHVRGPQQTEGLCFMPGGLKKCALSSQKKIAPFKCSRVFFTCSFFCSAAPTARRKSTGTRPPAPSARPRACPRTRGGRADGAELLQLLVIRKDK